ncbi:MAG: radical SAM protein [bacterium]|nr:radical SAM protein [bacterium]
MSYRLHCVKKSVSLRLLHLLQKSNYALSPRQLSIEITDDCNLNCYMCAHKVFKAEGGNLPLEKFKYILEQLPHLRRISIVGRGEPFMNPNLFNMLDLGKYRDINFNICTNGTLLNEKNIYER